MVFLGLFTHEVERLFSEWSEDYIKDRFGNPHHRALQ
jgi:hypothetical protein